MMTITPELREAMQQAGDQPASLVDLETNTTYLLVRKADFIVLPVDSSGKLSDQARDGLIREMGMSVGWDDPDMDIYNDLDPRTRS